MPTNNNSFLFLSLVVILIQLGSCKNRPSGNKNVKVVGLTKEEVLKKYEDTRAEFKIISFRGKADFETTKAGKEQRIGFSYQVNIAKDSLIWGSISKLGLPLGTVLIDQDSVRMRMSLGKIAVLCDFNVLTDMLGMEVDFGLVQSFFTGNPVFRSENLKMVPDMANGIRLNEERPPLKLSWFLNGVSFNLDKMVAEDSKLDRKSTVTYGNFQNISGQDIPGNTLIEVTQPEIVRIELEHTNIEIEPGKSTFNFRIPKSYGIKDCSFK